MGGTAPATARNHHSLQPVIMGGVAFKVWYRHRSWFAYSSVPVLHACDLPSLLKKKLVDYSALRSVRMHMGLNDKHTQAATKNVIHIEFLSGPAARGPEIIACELLDGSTPMKSTATIYWLETLLQDCIDGPQPRCSPQVCICCSLSGFWDESDILRRRSSSSLKKDRTVNQELRFVQ